MHLQSLCVYKGTRKRECKDKDKVKARHVNVGAPRIGLGTDLPHISHSAARWDLGAGSRWWSERRPGLGVTVRRRESRLGNDRRTKPAIRSAPW